MELLDFVKTKNIIKIAPDTTLSHALSSLKSSHDAAFVFDEKDNYMGLVNPYYSIIKTSLPGNAKVEHCLFHAPRIRRNFPIAKVAKLMIESKVHYLPVFDQNNKFVGITSARRLLNIYRNSSIYNREVGEFIRRKNQAVLTVYDTDVVSSAVNLFKKSKVSKLVVVNKNMKLYGILTYYDLINFLVTPRRKVHRGDKDGNRSSFQFQQVKNFAKTYVLTLQPGDNVRDALNLILDKKIGSVVIVDGAKNPIGIITTRDLLGLLIQERRDKRFEITLKNLSVTSKQAVEGFITQLKIWTGKLPNIETIKLFVKEEKRGGLFEAVVSLIPQRGKKQVIKREGKNLKKLLKGFGSVKKASRKDSS
ncbi:hypothetical protein A3G67_02790 [Candidatus Roizmanbacteria bacterium RIFCSPLOWO2_12_FULL_40_12]|uniref:CBS domain-containing protein n=1 Tax=Candidatus Roizmanbacteria bacterium RIFCSPLOWO2_01_FULL_40_42 TaxID=1802066 RepID=A0A1F7J2N5_9BACT|nr:MAG: hypothetical protein A2779_00320 [Candidatus Roizmanbacteria bacterium RIFCSPHIGHO2_01_FULL_40_98]OGK27504.1 MAG: hypothetical protein A3C31_03475 [Candidatus Roizmanbacteria bacterium RIFCSPHIGHO2_02_FULL_40_53]OGK30260.1 MAG: hypothetical protein A2W49_00960 [Candidatus Roizmanbacteria bacterium RIFCSPHIGHO2_12_41_18]OGK37140.1 MAG: hypothetical protein A3E69_01635 [Candidatus Roizmanbacteria bacterium RIFCSPHIGHO2_12_FULL_40_130]OGK49866.1 MAG: hypothetical protein A3B50_03715 [Candi